MFFVLITKVSFCNNQNRDVYWTNIILSISLKLLALLSVKGDLKGEVKVDLKEVLKGNIIMPEEDLKYKRNWKIGCS